MNRILPPTLAGLLVVIAVPLGTFLPGSNRLSPLWRFIGLGVIALGALVTHTAHSLFLRRGANLDTFGEPDMLLTGGPFAVTRNPMYLGLTMVLVGVALVVGSATAWVAPILFAAVADRWYIPLEEERMRARFGERYDAYQRRVPRWLRWPRLSGGDTE